MAVVGTVGILPTRVRCAGRVHESTAVVQDGQQEREEDDCSGGNEKQQQNTFFDLTSTRK